ncbi:MAG: NUDIX hydrolase [Desulfurococcales archaeon]|nr:NUDIX hydrolase [Desulfurococcales archaeon]
MEEYRIYPVTPIIGVGAVVLWDNKILLVKRGNEPYRGYWTIPGGVQRVNETLGEAALRELKEETGIDGVVKGVAWINELIQYEGNRIKYHYIIIDLYIEPLSYNVRPGSDVLDAGWFSLDTDWSTLRMSDAMKKLLAHLKKYGVKHVLPYNKPIIIGIPQ